MKVLLPVVDLEV